MTKKESYRNFLNWVDYRDQDINDIQAFKSWELKDKSSWQLFQFVMKISHTLKVSLAFQTNVKLFYFGKVASPYLQLRFTGFKKFSEYSGKQRENIFV